MPSALPHDACACLHSARSIGVSRNLSERRTGRCQVGSAEGYAIGGVERLEPELKIFALAERESLDRREVEVLRRVPGQVAELRVEGPYVIPQLLRGDSVELRRIEREAIRLVPLQMERAAIVNHVAPCQRRPRFPPP